MTSPFEVRLYSCSMSRFSSVLFCLAVTACAAGQQPPAQRSIENSKPGCDEDIIANVESKNARLTSENQRLTNEMDTLKKRVDEALSEIDELIREKDAEVAKLIEAKTAEQRRSAEDAVRNKDSNIREKRDELKRLAE